MGPSPEAIAAAEERIEKFQAWLMQQPDQQFPVFDYVRDDKGNILYFAEDGTTLICAKNEEGETAYFGEEFGNISDEDLLFASPKEIRLADKAYPLVRPEKAILKTFLLWERLVEPAQTQDSNIDGRPTDGS